MIQNKFNSVFGLSRYQLKKIKKTFATMHYEHWCSFLFFYSWYLNQPKKIDSFLKTLEGNYCAFNSRQMQWRTYFAVWIVEHSVKNFTHFLQLHSTERQV